MVLQKKDIKGNSGIDRFRYISKTKGAVALR